MVKVATVCSGIGAPEKALRNLGVEFETAYFCEFDQFAAKSYVAIHGEDANKNLGDLTKVEIEKLPNDIDLIVGGTPCQDFSVAGKRAGGTIDSKTRSSLMWNFVEIIRETQPKAVLWENVPGCLSGSMKSNFNKFLTTLSELGYKTTAEILNAKNFGVPQNRDRVFVLAIRKDIKSKKEICAECEHKYDCDPEFCDYPRLNIQFEMPKGYDCGIRLNDILQTTVDEKYYLSERAINGIINSTFTQKAQQVQNKNEICGTLMSRDYKDPKCICENELIELTQGQSQGNRVYDPKGLSVTLSANGGGQGAKTGLYQVPHGDNKGGYREVDNCPTITGAAFQQNNFVACAMRGRGKAGDIEQKLEVGGTIANSLTTVQKDSLVMFNPYNNAEIKDFAPTQTTGCGSITGSSTVLIANKKQEFCNELIEKELVKENDVITHSYTSHKRENNSYIRGENNMSPTLDTRCDCLGVVEKRANDLGIRKLTPLECLRLMGFDEKDYEACKRAEISDSQLYKQAGNSIVVNVLMAIFGELYGIDWHKKVYGDRYKTMAQRMEDLPMFQLKGGE